MERNGKTVTVRDLREWKAAVPERFGGERQTKAIRSAHNKGTADLFETVSLR